MTLSSFNPFKYLKRSKHGRIRLAATVLMSLIILLELQSTVQDTGLYQRVEAVLYDSRLNLSMSIEPAPKSDANIVVIDIDEKSLKEQGQWVWSREKLGKLVAKLAELGVVVVVFDISFPEPERNPVDRILPLIDEPQRKQVLAVKDQVDADYLFSSRLQDTDVVLGFFFQKDKDVRVGTLPEPILSLNEKRAERLVSIEMQGYAANLKRIQEAALSAGFVTTFPDTDGIVRRSPLVIEHEGQLYGSLALKAAMAYLFLDTVSIETTELGQVETFKSITLGEFPALTDAVGRVLIPFRGPAFTYPYISATDVLEDRVDPAQIEGGVAFVGASAIGIADLRSTAVGPQYPGVEIHANILDSLLNGHFPYNPDWEPAFTLLGQIVIGVILIWLLPKSGPTKMLVYSGVMLLVFMLANFYMWHVNLLDLPMTGTLILIIGLTSLFVAYGFLTESASRRQIKGMFNQYVPAAHIDHMLDDPDAYSFAGDNREMSVLFSDIRNFTNISEGLSASKLKLLLNTYFTPITKEIFDHDGTIDKYVGDMVMAFWGAPLEDPLHPQHAVDAALKMLKVTDELKPMFAAQGLPEVNIGIGINTGKMNVGDMGSTYRRSYTVLGDAVNLGSRLESITKFYGARLLIGENTYEKIDQSRYLIRFVDRIIVKGKEVAIRVYEPLAKIEDATESQKQMVQAFDEWYQVYLAKRWDEAKSSIAVLIDRYPEQKLFLVYSDRIDTLREQELPEDWDGTFRHTSK